MAVMARRMAITMVMTMAIDPALLLQIWLSPSFPVGSFAYSHGLEYAVQAEAVKDQATCREWLADLITLGSWHNDAIIAGVAWQAVTRGDNDAIADIIELGLALAPSRERHLESVQQGNAFMAAARRSWPHPALNNFPAAEAPDIPYAVALGIFSATHGIARDAMISAFGLGFAQALVSAALRLSIIGHTDGQKILASLLPLISQAAEYLKAATLDDLGSATFLSDIASLQHETQFTRFFRS